MGSQVRFRFDASYQIDSPDRAEFFYAKCGCYRLLATIGADAAVDPDAPGPGPGVPRDLNFQQLYFYGEYAPHNRISVFGEFPVGWLQPQAFKPLPPFAPFPNQSGVGDIRTGAKFALYRGEDRFVTAQFRMSLPSGDSQQGMGRDLVSIEPSLLFYQKLSDRAALEAQIGEWHPIGGSAGVPITSKDGFAGDVLTYAGGLSYEIYRGDRARLAPVVELFGWHVFSGLETLPGGPILGGAADASGTDILNVKIGARVLIGNNSSIYGGYGRALTNKVWYEDIVRVEYRYSF